MRTTSCGVLITKQINGEPHLLMCHATNNNFWDIPKGGLDINETPINAAIRELQEETGFIVKPEDLTDLGVFEYNNKKDLHLFLYNLDSKFNAEEGICTTYFMCPYKKINVPEVDDFKYIPYNKVTSSCAKSFIKVFELFKTKN
jgi:8-oxo-dGTP pyrophosphatase MutT (NUDIX family)